MNKIWVHPENLKIMTLLIQTDILQSSWLFKQGIFKVPSCRPERSERLLCWG